MGKLKDTVKGVANELSGNAKQAAARASNDPKLDAEGKAQERKGELQEAAGKVKGALGNRI